MIEQLYDSGAVIGYQPNLKYQKDNNVTEDFSNSVVPNKQQNISYSNALQGIDTNAPSKSIQDIYYVISNMGKLIDKLSKSFHSNNWNQYNDISGFLNAILNKNNSDEFSSYIKDFSEYHKNNIKGSIIPEIILTILDSKDRLEKIEELLKELFYGNKDYTLDQINEIETSYLERLKNYERNKNSHKINYPALSFDSILCRSISMHTFEINKQAIKLTDIISNKDKAIGNPMQLSFIEKLYQEVKEEIENRQDIYSYSQNIEILEKTFYSYYNKRQDLLQLYHLMSDTGSVYLGRKIISYQDNVENSIKNINRILIGNQIHLSELSKLMMEKHILTKIYADLGYNY